MCINVERLHGLAGVSSTMYSPRVHRVSHTMNRNARNNQVRGPSRAGRGTAPRRGGGGGGGAGAGGGRKPPRQNVQRRRPRGRGAFQPPYPEPYPISEGVSNFKPTSAGSAYATGQATTAPIIRATRESSRIIHRELVGSIVGSTLFATPFAFALNPGLSASFPWLSTQAQAWELYRFNKLEYKYFTRTASTTPGSVLLIPDYDAADAAPNTEVIASSYEDVTEDAPWKDQCCTLRPSSMHPIGPKKFVRTAGLAANLDVKTYDAGTLFVGTIDGTAVNWGKLWVEYDITLYTPQLQPQGTLQNAQHYAAAANLVPTSANMLGSAAGVISPSSTSNIVVVAGEVITFQQAGLFLVNYNVLTATTATQTVAPAVGAGNVAVTTFGCFALGFNEAGSATAQMMQSAVVRAVIGGTITFNNTIVGGTNAELLITQLPPTLV